MSGTIVLESAGEGLWRVRPFPMQSEFVRGYSLLDGGYEAALGYASTLASHLQCGLMDATGRIDEKQGRELVRAVRIERKHTLLSDEEFLKMVGEGVH